MYVNYLDRAIAAVAPAWAAKRVHARVQLAAVSALPDLRGAMDDAGAAPEHQVGYRLWGLSRDARSDTLPLLRSQRGQVRELARTSPIAAGAINTNIDRVVGTGLALSAQPALSVLGWSAEQAKEWKALVQREFSLWADSTDCDYEGDQTFYQLQALVLRSALESGDCFTILPDGERTETQPYALRLQVIEADRVGNPMGAMDSPQIAGGVRLEKGHPQAYYVYDAHPGSTLLNGKRLAGQWYERMGCSGRHRILHHFRKLRPGQPRGVPYLAPIIDSIKQISRYTNAEIEAAVITAYLTIFIETPDANNPVYAGEGPVKPGQELAIGSGTVVGLLPGHKPHIVNPSRPNPNFDPFLVAVIKQMGMALGLPFELLIKQFNSSFSASKAALLDAWIYFRGVRTWLAQSFCQPVFETWLAEAVALGRVPAVGFFQDPVLRWAYTRAAWPGDSMGSINPKDEVEAYVAAIDARLMTRERAEWELFGSDWGDTYQQKLTEHQQLAADGMAPAPKAGAAAPVQSAPQPEDENKDKKGAGR